MLRLSEIFDSIQGEGLYLGVPSTFVRTTGCNLRCWFCDTRYTSWEPEGKFYSVDDVIDQVLQYSSPHVVVTGGEPMLQPEVVPLTRRLSELGRVVTVETAGTVFRPVHADLMSISPKLSNSTPTDNDRWGPRHERLREDVETLNRLMDDYNFQLKFVVDGPGDLSEIEQFAARYPQAVPDRIWLMPQCRSEQQLRERSAWLPQLAEQRGYRFANRLHIELFGNVRGK